LTAKAQLNDWQLTALLLLYVVASLVHFTHNAEYLSDYPNLPPWLTRGGIYLAWIAETSLGVLGYMLYGFGWRLIGLALVGVYAAFGFDGLLHYTRAPFVAHTSAMNFTILFEVVAAALLLMRILILATRKNT
jgi:Na+/phosphate symporter